ncbi:MAG: MCP four helix bundle domain-containing protein, partial [Spirochaetota bacterium]
MFKNMKVSTKLILGFGLLLIFLLGIAIAGLFGLNQSNEGFNTYRALARETKLYGAVLSNILRIELDANRYIEHNNKNYLDDYNSAKQDLEEVLKDTHLIKTEERKNTINNVIEEFNQYDSAFNEVIELQEERNRLMYEEIDVMGPQITSYITQIMESANEEELTSIAFYGGNARYNFTLVRMHIEEYADINDIEIIREAESIMRGEFETAINQLDILIDDSGRRRELLNSIIAEKDSFTNAFIGFGEVIENRNRIRSSRMNNAESTIANAIEDVRDKVEEEQDIIGPEIKNTNENIMFLVIIFVIIAFVLSIIVAIIIYRSIINTLGGEPNFLASITKRISDGELDINWNSKKNKNANKKGLLADMITMVESLQNKSELIETIAEGDLSVKVKLASDRDVVGKSLKKMVNSLQKKSEVIETIADGDFTVKVELSSNKDVVGKSLKKMTKSLNQIFSQIALTVEEVKSGADQLSNSSQELSEGASDQASSLEEVTASLTQVSSQVQTNTENVVKSSR